MPMRGPWICGCGKTVPGATQCVCQKRRKIAVEKARPTARARGYTSKWSEASAAFLAMPGHDKCACGCGQRANMVHHKDPHKGDMRKFWDRSNWAPYNKTCNSRECASSEGGFGNPRREVRR